MNLRILGIENIVLERLMGNIFVLKILQIPALHITIIKASTVLCFEGFVMQSTTSPYWL